VTDDGEALAAAVEGAARIARRLRLSLADFASLGTLDAATVESFDDPWQQRTDALLKRVESLVAQLQDQVWRLAMTREQMPMRLGTRREKAEAMQRLGLLPPGEDFAAAARLRNRLADEYPTAPEKQARLMNDALASGPLLFDCVARAEAYLARSGQTVATP